MAIGHFQNKNRRSKRASRNTRQKTGHATQYNEIGFSI